MTTVKRLQKLVEGIANDIENGEQIMLDSEGYPVYPRNSREEAIWQNLLQRAYGE